MKVLLVRHSGIEDVRLQKYIKVFLKCGFDLHFVGWDRKEVSSKLGYKYIPSTYLLQGEGGNKFSKAYKTILWYIKSTFYILRNAKNYDYIYCADLEAAFPTFLASKFVGVDYIYDVYDQYDMRYKLPAYIASAIRKVDHLVRLSAYRVIHVDDFRISNIDNLDKTIVIYNSPIDSYEVQERKLSRDFSLKIGVTGYLTNGRGMSSIYEYARENPDIQFIIAGVFYPASLKNCCDELDNCSYIGLVSQDTLFEELASVDGIFSLYDPMIEINKYAASNKVYDAMALGVPIIVNNGLEIVDRLKLYGLGIFVDYRYSSSGWDVIRNKLSEADFRNETSAKSRSLFNEKYNFSVLVERLVEEL